jgi:1-aminocyclopropane-1-carboxylate deaminase/D-cysteine desulfhydrase-like pyridoxal-dependent ACC family enzyme
MRTEGLMVDPVYTAKALALVSRYTENDNVVFWHTGGQLDVVARSAEARSAEARSAEARSAGVGR